MPKKTKESVDEKVVSNTRTSTTKKSDKSKEEKINVKEKVKKDNKVSKSVASSKEKVNSDSKLNSADKKSSSMTPNKKTTVKSKASSKKTPTETKVSNNKDTSEPKTSNKKATSKSKVSTKKVSSEPKALNKETASKVSNKKTSKTPEIEAKANNNSVSKNKTASSKSKITTKSASNVKESKKATSSKAKIEDKKTSSKSNSSKEKASNNSKPKSVAKKAVSKSKTSEKKTDAISKTKASTKSNSSNDIKPNVLDIKARSMDMIESASKIKELLKEKIEKQKKQKKNTNQSKETILDIIKVLAKNITNNNSQSKTDDVESDKTTVKASTAKKKSSTVSKKKIADSKNSKSTKSKPLTKIAPSSFQPEYYDLPYKYNKTTVKILAQTPKNLFIYWEISDEDRENLKKQYGQYFFEITKPVLLIQNVTMNYYFEIDINDFANSWYISVNDSDCEYKIELGRRPIPVNYSYIPGYDTEKNGAISPIQIPYIYISSSNELSSPNDHILFNLKDTIYFRNIKSNEIIRKNIKDFRFINKNNEFINIYELYRDLYKDELTNNLFDLNNRSFINPSSLGISSKLK